MKKILVVDGNSILNRAFYGIRPLTNSKGEQTGAIFGMLKILKKHLDDLKPTYAAVTFDVHAPTFRHKMYDEYKAGRRPTPPELLSQFAPVKECLSLMGITVLEMAGYEADDLQGTVACMAHGEEDVHAYILSGDRDLLQLIDPDITVLLAGNAETLKMDRDAFVVKYGVEPSQFVDVKAVMGDSSDHIPGVPGIGEKGALKLISEFGSLDGIYENLDAPSITKGVREKLIAGKESAYMSRTLAKIKTDVPLERDLESLKMRPTDNDGLYRKLSELEFSDLIRRFELCPPGSTACVSQVSEHGASLLREGEYVTADAETLLVTLKDEVAVAVSDSGVSLCDGEHRYLYTGALFALSALFDGKRSIITADGKRLLHTLWQAGIPAELVPKDVLLAAYVRNAGAGATLAHLCTQLLEVSPREDEPTAHLLYALWHALYLEVERIGCTRLLNDIELPLSLTLARMEREGFHLDVSAMKAFGERLYIASAELEDSIHRMAGGAFNIQSPKQLSEVLFDRLCLPVGKRKRNKSGFYSTDAETLEGLRYAHPIVDAVLEYRHVTKLYSTYAVGLPLAADGDGRIHTEFKQAFTSTGRLSSAEPNLQNIPVRTKLGREIRRCFVAKGDDYTLVDADYSQIELRLLAAIAGDEAMIHAFRAGQDIHAKTAAAVFRVPIEAVTEEMRKYAKAVNFGIVYGISAYSLSGDLKITVAAAKSYIETYFAEYPQVRAYLDRVVDEAVEKGYTSTLLGRRRYIPELSSSNHMTREFGKRVAMNSPIQGTAADIIKIAMVRVDRRLQREGLDAHLVMQVHDELIVEAHKDIAEYVAQLLHEEMERAYEVGVPLTVDVTVGKSWCGE